MRHLKTQGINKESAVALAKAFYGIGSSALRAKPSAERDVNNGYVEHVIAGAACVAFSCEVSMKAMLFGGSSWDEAEGRHDLRMLFDMMDDEDRAFVRNATLLKLAGGASDISDAESFERALSESSDAFIQLRYWYELPGPGKGKSAKVAFLDALGSSFITLLETHFK